MTLNDWRAKLDDMKRSAGALKEQDADFFASLAFTAARDVDGALWKPHARAEARSIASEFETLGREALNR